MVLLPALVLLLPFCAAQAADNGNSSDYAWAEKFGYISFNGAGAAVDYGVTVAAAGLSGYAWSEKTGWINFDDAGAYYAVTNDGSGNLSGYAWSEKLGYISFDDSSVNNYYQVIIAANGIFSGYAWSEKAGYINMNDAGSLYGVTTTWTRAGVTTQNPTNVTKETASANANITSTAGLTITTRGFKYGLTPADTWDANEAGSFGTGTYSLSLSGLTKGTTYYIRAYIINSQSTYYGDYVQFITGADASEMDFGSDVNFGSDVEIH